MSTLQLKQDLQNLRCQYDEYRGKGLNLNISRGLPCKEQLDLNA